MVVLWVRPSAGRGQIIALLAAATLSARTLLITNTHVPRSISFLLAGVSWSTTGHLPSPDSLFWLNASATMTESSRAGSPSVVWMSCRNACLQQLQWLQPELSSQSSLSLSNHFTRTSVNFRWVNAMDRARSTRRRGGRRPLVILDLAVRRWRPEDYFHLNCSAQCYPCNRPARPCGLPPVRIRV